MDVIAAVRWLKSRHSTSPIVIWGASLGSAAAVFAMKEIGNEVRGVILECPYRDLDTALWHRMQSYLPPILDRVGYLGLRTAGGLVVPHFKQISPLNAIDSIPTTVPVLILAGSHDRRARPEEAQELHARIASHSRFELIENADHLKLYEAAPTHYPAIVLKYLRQLHSTVESTNGL